MKRTEHDPSKAVVLPPGSRAVTKDGVYIADGVSPQAAEYASSLLARTQAKRGLPKYQAPSGGPPVRIPRLDSPHQVGMPMSAQAAPSQEEMQRIAKATLQELQQRSVSQGGEESSSIVEMPTTTSMVAESPQGGPNPSMMGILPTDVLPPEATKDPNYRSGYGSMFAHAQPHLAQRYGVLRNNVRLSPQQLLGDRKPPKLRPETMKDLQVLQDLQKQSQETRTPNLHSSEEDIDDTLEGSAAAASAKAGNLPGDEEYLPSKKKVTDNSGMNIDELTFDQFRQRMMRDILNNQEQKERIEKGLPELQIEDLILRNRIEQRVPIVSGFEVTYQSMTGGEDLALKRLIMEEAKAVEVSDRYLLDKYSIMSMTVGAFAINGKPLGEHCDSKGDFDDDLFWKKFKRMLRLPTHMLASVGVNHFWFEQRVRKLFVAEKVGNG